MRSRRIAAVEVTPSLITGILQRGTGACTVVKDALPPDAKMIGAHFDDPWFVTQGSARLASTKVVFYFESESFAEVEEGCVCPTITPCFRQVEASGSNTDGQESEPSDDPEAAGESGPAAPEPED